MRAGSSRADRLAWAGACALLLGLILFGQRYHWVEEAGTAERDGYVGQAQRLLSGSLPRDPYRPLLYPLLTAALTPLTGEAFAAARLLSNLAAASLAWLAYAYGRRLGVAAAGGWAMALAAVNPNVWIIGQHTTTDMMFAALAAACLLAALRYLQAPATASAVAAGLTLGLAAFTRGNAVFLLPALLAAWWWASAAPAAPPVPPVPPSVGAAGPRRRRLPHLALAAAAAALGLLPHWVLRHAEFGNPFYDENWKNLAFKLYGYPDWSYFDRVPFHSLAEVVAQAPAAVQRAAAAELWRFATAGAAQLFGTWPHTLLVGAGAVWAVANRATRRSSAWLVFALASFLAATALTFFTWGRLLLLLLPGGYALAFTVLGQLGVVRDGEAAASLSASRRDLRAWGGLRSARLILAALGAAAVLLLAVKTFAFRLPAFVARHPYVEVEQLRRLDATLVPGEVLAGSSPFVGRYLKHRYVALPDAFGLETAEPARYFARLARLVREARVAYLVIGPLDLRSRPKGLLGASAPVPWLKPAGGERGVVVWKVIERLTDTHGG